MPVRFCGQALSALLFCLGSLSWGTNSCDPVDLRNTFAVTAQSQGSSKWCTSFAAANLASFYLKRIVSPVDLGIQISTRKGQQQVEAKFRSRTNNNPNDFSTLKEASIDGALRHSQTLGGFCLDRDLSTQAPETTGADGRSGVPEILNEIEDLHGQIETLSSANRARYIDDFKPYALELWQTRGSAIFVNVDAEEFWKILTSAKTGEVLATLGKKTCSRRVTRGLNTESKMTLIREGPAKDSLLYLINNGLKNGHPSGVVVRTQPNANRNVFSFSFSAHAMVVMGRRPNLETGACEYLILNSWGNDCGVKNSNPEIPWTMDLKNCEEGYFWTAEENLKGDLTIVSQVRQ